MHGYRWLALRRSQAWPAGGSGGGVESRLLEAFEAGCAIAFWVDVHSVFAAPCRPLEPLILPLLAPVGVFGSSLGGDSGAGGVDLIFGGGPRAALISARQLVARDSPWLRAELRAIAALRLRLSAVPACREASSASDMTTTFELASELDADAAALAVWLAGGNGTLSAHEAARLCHRQQLGKRSRDWRRRIERADPLVSTVLVAPRLRRHVALVRKAAIGSDEADFRPGHFVLNSRDAASLRRWAGEQSQSKV